MKQKGFTLIELLGVVILLALLIILIFPSVINFIKGSSDETDELTLELIYNAADTYIIRHKNEFQEKNGNKYIISLRELVNDGLLVAPIELSNNDITDTKSVQVSYNEEFNYELKDNHGCEIIYSDGTVVYFDVQQGTICNESEYKVNNSKTGYNGINGTANQTSCLKFYAFLDDGSDTVNLILDHNTSHFSWIIKYTPGVSYNDNGPYLALEQLYNDTKNWNVTSILNDYTMDQRDQLSKSYYTIKYSEIPEYENATTKFKSRLITAQEIAQITGADKLLNWDETITSDWYYLDGAKGTDLKWQTQLTSSLVSSEYYWLFDNTSDCNMYGCVKEDSLTDGYWTSSSFSGDDSSFYAVENTGILSIITDYGPGLIGIRPVITISKIEKNN